MSKKEIKLKWEKKGAEASGLGTKMHYDIECFYNKMNIVNNSIEFEYFKNFQDAYVNLKPYRTEWMIYDKELKFAGSIDMVFKEINGSLMIFDWKRCKEIKKVNSWQKAKTDCIGHLDDCNFNHYCLQLNTYKYILEKNYDEKVSGMFLVCLHPNNKNKDYIKMEVPNLTSEIKELMKLRYNSIYNK